MQACTQTCACRRAYSSVCVALLLQQHQARVLSSTAPVTHTHTHIRRFWEMEMERTVQAVAAFLAEGDARL
jgi:hypothetical protein